MRILTLRQAIGCAAFFLLIVTAGAASTNFAAQAERNFQQALEAWKSNGSSSTAAVQVARRAFDWAEFASKDADRAELGNRGIEAARAVAKAEPTNAAAHYWLGMNLGQLARTKWLGAIPLVKEMSDAFFRARDLDETVDYCGPNRSLGLLFREAPGWPTSVGDKKKARIYLERAAKLCPDFPENQLCLLESYEKWGERTNFLRQLTVVEQAIEKARPTLTGEEWAYTWHDWEKRLAAMKAKAAVVGRASETKGATVSVR